MIVTACSSGSSSPTEPSADALDFTGTAADDGVSGSSSAGEVDGIVTGVDSSAQSISLASGDRVVVDFNTRWDPLGDLVTINQLESAFKSGQTVRVEADGKVIDAGTVLAETIKAETDGNDFNDPNDDNPNDDPNDDSDFDDDLDSDDSDSGEDSDDSDDTDFGDDSDDSDDADSDSDDSDDSESDDSNNSGKG